MFKWIGKRKVRKVHWLWLRLKTRISNQIQSNVGQALIEFLPTVFEPHVVLKTKSKSFCFVLFSNRLESQSITFAKKISKQMFLRFVRYHSSFSVESTFFSEKSFIPRYWLLKLMKCFAPEYSSNWWKSNGLHN